MHGSAIARESPKLTDSPDQHEGVAVIIAAWRASATIGRAVASALAQAEAAEVVVVDDASGDNWATVAAAQAADDDTGRLRIVILPRNSGPAFARNEAIRVSKSPWICILDSDDFMETGRLASLMKIAAAGYDFVADDVLQATEGADISTRRPMWFDQPSEGVDVTLGLFVSSNISRRGRSRRELGFIKPIMRRAFLEAHALSYQPKLRLGEDYDLYLRALAAGARFRLTPAMGYVAVMRENSLSAVHSRADLAALSGADASMIEAGGLAPADATIVRSHQRSIDRRIAWIDFMDAVKARQGFSALRILVKDPLHAPSLLARFTYVAARKTVRAIRR